MPTIPSTSLASFEKYTSQLRTLLHDSPFETVQPGLVAALDGEPGRKLRDSVQCRLLRESGTFFTGKELSSRLLEGLPGVLSGGATDPACGAGDLLLAVARNLPIDRTFEKTMDKWASLLVGCDIHREFVSATKLRIALLALHRGAHPPKSDLDVSCLLPNITYGDGMMHRPVETPKLVIMNPPYTRVVAPDDCSWGKGLVSSAALFVSRWLDMIPKGGRLIAILPDVLRTGSNYRLWREAVLKRSKVERLRILGRFDASTDVDVFAVDFVVGSDKPCEPGPWMWSTVRHRAVVSTRFSVSVGTIVPHRDRKIGELHAYLNAQLAPPWGTCIRLNAKIRTKRRLFKPPFVVVRRTSSPSDPVRAIGTVILGTRPVAVENHLLVLTPGKPTVEECGKLLGVLKSTKTTKWLNQRIRCRHLTVGAVRDIPWWSD
jgi:hypothetical protein